MSCRLQGGAPRKGAQPAQDLGPSPADSVSGPEHFISQPLQMCLSMGCEIKMGLIKMGCESLFAHLNECRVLGQYCYFSP